jgi:hypothetical protein
MVKVPLEKYFLKPTYRDIVLYNPNEFNPKEIKPSGLRLRNG